MLRLLTFVSLLFAVFGCSDDDSLPDAGPRDVGVDAEPDIPIVDVGNDVGPCPEPSINLVSNAPAGAGLEANFFITPSGTGPLLDFRDATFELISDTPIEVTGVTRPSGGLHVVAYRTGHALFDFPTGFAVDEPVEVRIELGTCVFDVPFDLRIAPEIVRVSEGDAAATGEVSEVDIADDGTVVFSSDDEGIDPESAADACAGGCVDVFMRAPESPLVHLSAGVDVHARAPHVNDDASLFSFAAGNQHQLIDGAGASVASLELSACTDDCDEPRFTSSDLVGIAPRPLYAFADFDAAAEVRVYDGTVETFALGTPEVTAFGRVKLQPSGGVAYVQVGGARDGVHRLLSGSNIFVSAEADSFFYDGVSEMLIGSPTPTLALRSFNDIAGDGTLNNEPIWMDAELGFLDASDDLSVVLAWRRATGGTVAIELLRREGDAYERIALPFGRVLIPSASLSSAAISSDGKWAVFISADAILGQAAGTPSAYRIRIAR